jgi:hypothetical protein
MTWKPIIDAPKDGSEFIATGVGDDGKRYYVGAAWQVHCWFAADARDSLASVARRMISFPLP